MARKKRSTGEEPPAPIVVEKTEKVIENNSTENTIQNNTTENNKEDMKNSNKPSREEVARIEMEKEKAIAILTSRIENEELTKTQRKNLKKKLKQKEQNQENENSNNNNNVFKISDQLINKYKAGLPIDPVHEERCETLKRFENRLKEISSMTNKDEMRMKMANTLLNSIQYELDNQSHKMQKPSGKKDSLESLIIQIEELKLHRTGRATNNINNYNNNHNKQIKEQPKDNILNSTSAFSMTNKPVSQKNNQNIKNNQNDNDLMSPSQTINVEDINVYIDNLMNNMVRVVGLNNYKHFQNTLNKYKSECIVLQQKRNEKSNEKNKGNEENKSTKIKQMLFNDEIILLTPELQSTFDKYKDPKLNNEFNQLINSVTFHDIPMEVVNNKFIFKKPLERRFAVIIEYVKIPEAKEINKNCLNVSGLSPFITSFHEFVKSSKLETFSIENNQAKKFSTRGDQLRLQRRHNILVRVNMPRNDNQNNRNNAQNNNVRNNQNSENNAECSISMYGNHENIKDALKDVESVTPTKVQHAPEDLKYLPLSVNGCFFFRNKRLIIRDIETETNTRISIVENNLKENKTDNKSENSHNGDKQNQRPTGSHAVIRGNKDNQEKACKELEKRDKNILVETITDLNNDAISRIMKYMPGMYNKNKNNNRENNRIYTERCSKKFFVTAEMASIVVKLLPENTGISLIGESKKKIQEVLSALKTACIDVMKETVYYILDKRINRLFSFEAKENLEKNFDVSLYVASGINYKNSGKNGPGKQNLNKENENHENDKKDNHENDKKDNHENDKKDNHENDKKEMENKETEKKQAEKKEAEKVYKIGETINNKPQNVAYIEITGIHENILNTIKEIEKNILENGIIEKIVLNESILKRLCERSGKLLLNTLTDSSGVLNISYEDGNDYIFVIGSKKTIEKCKNRLDVYEKKIASEIEVKISVPKDRFGAVVGKGGVIAHHIRESTGISTLSLLEESDEILLRGTESEIENAKDLIFTFVESRTEDTRERKERKSHQNNQKDQWNPQSDGKSPKNKKQVPLKQDEATFPALDGAIIQPETGKWSH